MCRSAISWLASGAGRSQSSSMRHSFPVRDCFWMLAARLPFGPVEEHLVGRVAKVEHFEGVGQTEAGDGEPCVAIGGIGRALNDVVGPGLAIQEHHEICRRGGTLLEDWRVGKELPGAK